MRPTRLLVTIGIAAGLLLLLPGVSGAQCSMCRTALESPEARALAEAFRSGILFLLAVPFLAFGTVALLAVRSQRRHSSRT